jgi:hypothetical protein
MARAVDDLPIRGHTVAGGVRICVGVVKVRHLFIPFLCQCTPQVRPGNKRAITPHLHLGLKGICDIGVVFVWRTGVH